MTGEAMVAPHMAVEEVGSALGSDGGVGGDKVCSFADQVNNVQDGVIPVYFWEFNHKIDADGVPAFMGYAKRVKLADRLLVLDLRPHARIAKS